MRARAIVIILVGAVVVAGTAGATRYYLWKEAQMASDSGLTSEADLQFFDDVNEVNTQARMRYDTLGYQRESEYITHLERIDAMLAGRPWTPPPRPAFNKKAQAAGADAGAPGGGDPAKGDAPKKDDASKGADASKSGAAPKGKGKGMFGGPPAELLPKLSAEERKAHFAEIIKRWEERTKKSLRAELDAVKGRELAPGELKQRFGELMTVEYEVVREARDRYIAKEIKPVLEKHRAQHPKLVQDYESGLKKPRPISKDL